MAYVYRHIRLDKNEPFYIGIGSEDTRRSTHVSIYKRAFEKTRRSGLWSKIIAKADYEVEILLSNLSSEEAKQKEIEFIALYGRKDLGTGCLVNMTDGGDGLNNRVFTPEYRKKLSEAMKGRVITEAQKEKLREMSRNRKFTPEQKKQISEKLSKAHKGKPQPQSIIDLLKLRTGEKNPMYGKTNYNFKGMIQAFDEQGNLAGEFRGVHECAKQLNITATKISACLTGRRNRTGGYTFRRIEMNT